MKTLRIVILDEDHAADVPPTGPGDLRFAGLDPRDLENLSGSAAARLLREHARPLSFVDTDLGALDAEQPHGRTLEDRLQEALRAEDPAGQPLPVLLLPPTAREDAAPAFAAGALRYPFERLNDSLVRVLRRHELEAAITEADARLRQVGLRDARHGLPRRELLLDRLEQAAAAVQRGGMSFTLLMIGAELAGGHGEAEGGALPHAGTLLNEAMSARLQRLGRRSDSYARIGGHSYAALLLGTGSVAAAMSAAHKIAEDLGRAVMVAGRTVQPQVSVGMALCPQHGTDARQLLLHAHAAMEQAQSRRHAVALYDARYSRTLHERGEAGATTMPLQGEALAPLLQRAIEQHEIDLAFQPVVDLVTGRVLHLEALARWHLPHEGAVAPREFVAVAEHHGLIATLTDQLLERALACASGWRTAGLTAALSINISVLLLADEDFPRRLDDALQRHGWPAQALTLEISAPALMEHGDSLPAVLAALSHLGVGLAVDDFGTGLVSFQAVAELGDLSLLKLDLAALRGDPRSLRPQRQMALLAAGTALAHGLGARVVAQGVELASDLAALHGLGIDALQGHVCARPMPAEQVRAWWQGVREHPLAWLGQDVADPQCIDLPLDDTD